MSNIDFDFNINLLPSSPIEYTPATDEQISTYHLLASGTAFNDRPKQNAILISTAISNLKTIMLALGGAQLSTTSLNSSVSAVAALVDHLDYQFENLIDNLQLVSSGISDAIGYGIIGTTGAPAGSINNPTASYQNFFGSICGKSDQYVAQLANQVTAMTIYAAMLLAGAMIATLSQSTIPAIQTAIGALSNATTLQSTLTQVNQTNIQTIATAVNALGVYFSSPNAVETSEDIAVIRTLVSLGIVTGATTAPSSGSSSSTPNGGG